jgi:hypothetical protein
MKKLIKTGKICKAIQNSQANQVPIIGITLNCGQSFASFTVIDTDISNDVLIIQTGRQREYLRFKGIRFIYL